MSSDLAALLGRSGRCEERYVDYYILGTVLGESYCLPQLTTLSLNL